MASVSIDIDTEMNVRIKNDQKTSDVLLFCIYVYQVCGVWMCILVLSGHIFGRSGEDRELIDVCSWLSLPLSHTIYIHITKLSKIC